LSIPSDDAKDLAARLFQAKRERRRKLAALPIERKIAILMMMQKTANDIRRKTGRRTLPEWSQTEISVGDSNE
jgi:hypothetical protein